MCDKILADVEYIDFQNLEVKKGDCKCGDYMGDDGPFYCSDECAGIE